MRTILLYLLSMIPLCLSYSQARQHLAETIKTCVDDVQPVLIKSRKREVVMISRDEYESWLETMHLLSSAANAAHLEESIQEMQRGETVQMSLEQFKNLMKPETDESDSLQKSTS